MSLISSSIPNFVNGVSQQPFTLRLSSQGELQENALSTVAAGLQKRAPTEHIKKILETPLTDAFIHTLDRDGLERYKVILTNGNLRVFDLLGNEKTVNFTNQAYLNTALAASDTFACTTVADYTFICNKGVDTAASASLTPTRPYEALFNVKLGHYGKTYSILVGGVVVASYATPDGTTVADSPKLATDFIATQLFDAMVLAGYNVAPWAVTQHGSVIYLTNSTTDFHVATEDGFGSNAMVAAKGQLQKFSDLPMNPKVDGFLVEIIGEQSTDFDNYWVQFDAEGNDDSIGVWREAVAPGISEGLDPLTMPHLLIREADDTFTFKPGVWSKRIAGDMTSNPDPSFVGRKINDVFFFQNRLGLLSDENYIQTETGKYFNLFRTTVTTLLDSDPVDVNAATNKVAILKHVVPFNKNLLLFSNQQQFEVDGAELMSPKRVPLKPTTEFSVNTRAAPVACGKNVYFATNKGRWSALREFFVDTATSGNDATDITAHVPKYLPSGVVKIAAGSNEDTLVVLSENDRQRLYVYRYYFSGVEKLQSSWSKFVFATGASILDADFLDSTLYLLISRADGTYIEKLDMSLGAEASGEPYLVHLDRKVQIVPADMTFDGTNTTIDLASIGYTPVDSLSRAVTHGGGTIKAGRVLVPVAGTSNVFRGDFTASNLSFGQTFMWRYTISKLTVKLAAVGGGIKSDTEGRTQVRKIAFNHADTGYYQIKVTPEARQTYTYIFSGKVLATPSAVIGEVNLNTGRFIAPVMSRNTTVDITLESDSPMPVSILSADWEAFYVKRSKPV